MFAEHDAAIDTASNFSGGVSNGGMFVQRLAIEHAEIYAGVASIISSILEPLQDGFQPSMPVSVLFINGTDDPFVPYDGGEVTINLFPNVLPRKPQPSRGQVLSTDESIRLWRKRNGIGRSSVSAHVADLEPQDGAVGRIKTYADGERGTCVSLYKVVGGDHTISGDSKFISPKRYFREHLYRFRCHRSDMGVL